VPKYLVDRLLVEIRNVFVKYVGRNGLSRLSIKQCVLFYASEASKEIVGEGTIAEIGLLTPRKYCKNTASKYFLTRLNWESTFICSQIGINLRSYLFLSLQKLKDMQNPSFLKTLSVCLGFT
jgi:hypothetical protein